jgi:hypothetical protein
MNNNKTYEYIIYLSISCNWVDTRWQGSLHVTLAWTVKIFPLKFRYGGLNVNQVAATRVATRVTGT